MGGQWAINRTQRIHERTSLAEPDVSRGDAEGAEGAEDAASIQSAVIA